MAGYLNFLQGDTAEAKARLTRALRPAHTGIGNHQLVCQLLNYMSVFQLESGDIDGAQQMQVSSFTLSKNAHDLPTQIGALSAMEGMYSKRCQDDKLNGTVAYREKKEAQILLAVQKATSDNSQQRFIADWQVKTKEENRMEQ